jgi:DNA-binding NtrC family response regulator
MTPEALRALEDYAWPGNIRQLRNVIERAVALAPGPEIDTEDLPEAIRSCVPAPPVAPGAGPAPARGSPARARTLAEAAEEAEILRITEALRAHCNNRLRAAEELGISRMGLYKKLHKYGLFRDEGT